RPVSRETSIDPPAVLRPTVVCDGTRMTKRVLSSHHSPLQKLFSQPPRRLTMTVARRALSSNRTSRSASRLSRRDVRLTVAPEVESPVNITAPTSDSSVNAPPGSRARRRSILKSARAGAARRTIPTDNARKIFVRVIADSLEHEDRAGQRPPIKGRTVRLPRDLTASRPRSFVGGTLRPTSGQGPRIAAGDAGRVLESREV